MNKKTKHKNSNATQEQFAYDDPKHYIDPDEVEYDRLHFKSTPQMRQDAYKILEQTLHKLRGETDPEELKRGVEKLSSELEKQKRNTNQIIVRPTSILQLMDNVHVTPPTRSVESWNGKEVEVATYKPANPNDPELKVAYPKGLQDTQPFRYTSMLYAYADAVGFHSSLPHTIVFNDLLDYLGYKRDEDNTHDINSKKRVWKALYIASKTNIRTEFQYWVKTNPKTKAKRQKILFDKPLLDDLVGIYTRNGQDVKMRDYEETPPDKIIVKTVDVFINQLQGKRLDGGSYITKDATITPKIEAGEWKGKYQGNAMPLLEYIYLQLKKYPSRTGIRNYLAKELVKRGSNIKRYDKALIKTVAILSLFEKDKMIGKWGFRATLKGKILSKHEKKGLYIWIDFSGVDAYKSVQSFNNKRDNDSRLKKLEQQLDKEKEQREKDTQRITQLEATNKKYDVK